MPPPRTSQRRGRVSLLPTTSNWFLSSASGNLAVVLGFVWSCQSDLDILAACPSPAYFRNARKLSQPRLFRSTRTTIKALTDHTVCRESSHSISWLQVPAKSSITPPIRLPQRENYRGEIKTELQAPFLTILHLIRVTGRLDSL